MSQLNKKSLLVALEYLKTIPQMEYVLYNIERGIKFVFSRDIPGVACFTHNKIIVNPEHINLQKKRDNLALYIILAHELRHANQCYENLCFNNLIKPTFGETFRVAKMMEIETCLQDSILEHDLLQRTEFKKCKPSSLCLYYRYLLKTTNNISLANTRFVLSHWQNGKNLTIDNPRIKSTISNYYFFYTNQAYHNAMLIHDDRLSGIFKKTPKVTHPLEAMQTYIQRMVLQPLPPKAFLQNNFDCAQTTDDFRDGVTILCHSGDKFINIAPSGVDFIDKEIFYVDNQPYEIMLIDDLSNKKHGPFPYTNTPIINLLKSQKQKKL